MICEVEGKVALQMTANGNSVLGGNDEYILDLDHGNRLQLYE